MPPRLRVMLGSKQPAIAKLAPSLPACLVTCPAASKRQENNATKRNCHERRQKDETRGYYWIYESPKVSNLTARIYPDIDRETTAPRPESFRRFRLRNV